MNISKEFGIESYISRAVKLGQEFLDRSSGLSAQASSQVARIGSEGLRVTEDARNAVAAGLVSTAQYIGTRRSVLRSPVVVTLGIGAVAAAVAYYNRQKIKTAAIRAKEALEPQVRQAASKVQTKVSEFASSAVEAVEGLKQVKRSPDTTTAMTH